MSIDRLVLPRNYAAVIMPVRRGVVRSSGKLRPFFQWGNDPHTKKYFYTANNPAGREQAKKKAALQGRAIKAAQARR